MDYLKSIISNYIYSNKDTKFTKPDGYKNINTSSTVKK